MSRPQTDEIVVDHLTKQYKKLRAVDNLSFRVRTGRVTGFLGPNGAGKTTTLRMLLGLVTPTAGSATFGGRRYSELPDPMRRVGAVLEASSAHRGRTGRNHLRMICRAAGLPDSRGDEMLAMVGLTPAANRRFKGYSLGMKQRLGIAAAMLGNPGVLILDEPANGLDPEGIRWMRDLLRALAGEGRTVLVSSHLLGEMQQLADDVVIVAAGQLTAALDPLHATVARQPDGSLLVTGADAAAIGHAAFTASVELHELAGERGDLEQVFLQLTAGKAGIR
jgi:ABC-2 type transport system ATP-binding protein